MGRKETHYLQMLNCDSMAQQNMKMRPVLLKRNSLDSVDFMRQPHHRRSKSQQVRFKDDGMNTKTTGVTETDTHPAQDTAVLTGNTKTNRHQIFCQINLHLSQGLRKAFTILPYKRLQASGNTSQFLKGKS